MLQYYPSLCSRFTAGRRRYTVQFSTMVQVNEETGNRRPIMLAMPTKEEKKKEEERRAEEEEKEKGELNSLILRSSSRNLSVSPIILRKILKLRMALQVLTYMIIIRLLLMVFGNL